MIVRQLCLAKLLNIFASKTRPRIMSLKKKLNVFSQDGKTIVEYLQYMKGITDERALAQALIATDDLVIFIFKWLGGRLKGNLNY
ncbi:Uncharacterized protein TCM_014331 [Theobroma cacao]|uniref:Uncharacterized protein n=1 Tax=Theobroma cacao TaxID=3641 RepID=A0A061FX83_THECC|nr:Uncharacterized protein TCM_014331 [Theobroma cacao]